jgi:CTP-dependent riboflavin kinase
MSEYWQRVSGVVCQGHRVASGTGDDRRYPEGTLRMQRPFFAERGFDLAPFFEGTLNVEIAPWTFALAKPMHTYRQVRWTELHPPEDFSFSRCRVVHRSVTYGGWVYTPHPETKAAHFQPPTMLEIIAPWMEGVNYGAVVELWLPAEEIAITS